MRNSIFLLLAVVLTAGCNDQSSAPVPAKATIKGLVRIGFDEAAIRYPVGVRLRRITRDRFDSIAFRYTDSYGRFTFSNVDTGEYEVCPSPDLNYDYSICANATVTSNTRSLFVQAGVLPFHYLYPESLTLAVDTSALSNSYSLGFVNLGTRDTIICQFDFTSKPSWMDIAMDSTVFPPSNISLGGIQGYIGIYKSTFPIHPWPGTIKFPIKTQFETDTLYVIFVPGGPLPGATRFQATPRR
jgi:hypothetical protein